MDENDVGFFYHWEMEGPSRDPSFHTLVKYWIEMQFISITGSEFIGGGKAVPLQLAKIATDVFVSYVDFLASKKQEIGAC